MKNVIVGSVISLAVLTAAMDAQSQERWPRWYVGLSGSMTWLQDSDLDGANGEVEFDSGYGVGAQLGYMPALGNTGFNGLRIEGEVYYRTNDVDSLRAGGVGLPSSGDMTSTAYMLNALYDFNETQMSFTPYVGAGIGWADVELDAGALGSDDDNVLAYQLMAGLSYSPETMPMTVWSLGYRYFATDDPEFGNVEAEYDSHNLEANVRFRF